MPALDEILRRKLELMEQKDLRRRLNISETDAQMRVQCGGKALISFSSNDYLGLAHHPAVIYAASEALAAYGLGAGASRLVTGNHALNGALEASLAGLKNTESALVFGSGYLATIGVVPALVGKGDMILADKLSHACMLDAAKLSGAEVYRFAHNNAVHAREILQAHRGEHTHCLIMTETVFSMDGDLAPLGELAALAEEYDAWLFTDDAHGLGVLPESAENPAEIQMGTLSKAAGAYGGYICASRAVIDYVQTSARSLIYSTGLPPALLAGANAAIGLIRDQPELGARACGNAEYFAHIAGLPTPHSAIVPVILGEAQAALAASARLAEEGFLVQAIRPPTVPPGTARLRFTFSAAHETGDIERLGAVVKREILCPA